MAMSEPIESDVLTPSKCGPCLIENKDKEATMYCVECNDMLCDTCVGIHKRFPTMKTHQIVLQTDKEQFEFTAKMLSDKCGKHEGKHLETLCKTHDEICCSVCVSINHRMCDGLVYLPEFAKETTTKDICHGKIKEIDQMKANFENLKKNRNADKLEMGMEKNSVKEIDASRRELIAESDRYYRNSSAEVDSGNKSNLKSVNNDIEACEDNVEELNKFLCSLMNENIDEVRRFIGAKRTDDAIKQLTEKLNSISRRECTSSVYKLKPTVKTDLKEVKGFGEFEKQPAFRSSEDKEEKLVSSYDIQIGKMICKRHLPKEKEFVSIQGMALMKNGQIICADWENQNLKLLNKNLDTIHTIPLPAKPRNVCVIENDICISYKLEKKVEIGTLFGNTFKTKRIFNVGIECRDVCYKNNELIIACDYEDTAVVRVYSTDGDLKRTFDRDTQGKKLFSSPYSVKTNADGCLLYVVNHSRNEVIALKLDGTLMWKYSDTKVLQSVWDIAVDENDDLYVSGYLSRNILKISADGQKANVVLSRIRYPSAVCYDGANERLVISTSTGLYCDTPIVYQVIRCKN